MTFSVVFFFEKNSQSPTGKADKIGVGYEKLSEINPRIVYASLTGYLRREGEVEREMRGE